MNGCCVNKKHGYPDACTEETCMDLPVGMTCGDCAHIYRCRIFGFSSSESNTSCDFFPRRFSKKRVEFVYQPHGVAGGHVFTSWAELMVAVAATDGPKHIFIPDPVPPGTDDMKDVTISSIPSAEKEDTQ